MPQVFKPNAREFKVKEQVYEDLLTGIGFRFEVRQYPLGEDGKIQFNPEFVLTIFGNGLEFDSREIVFDNEGRVVATGSSFCQHQNPI